MKKVKVVMVKNREIFATEIEDDYRVIQQEIGCDYFEVVQREISGDVYDIYCDDEGLFKANLTPAVITISRETRKPVEQIVGNIIIARHTDDGDMQDLSQADIGHILFNAKRNGIIVSLV